MNTDDKDINNSDDLGKVDVEMDFSPQPVDIDKLEPVGQEGNETLLEAPEAVSSKEIEEATLDAEKIKKELEGDGSF